LPAPQASPCWLTSAAAPILEAVCDRSWSGTSFELAVPDLRCARSVIIGPGRAQHVVLGDSERVLTLKLEGSRAALGPVGTTFLLRRIPDPARLASDFATLDALLHMPRSRARGSRNREVLRNALVALDGRHLGASHRDIAEVILGRERVREDWSGRGGWLKERMRRAVAIGERLRDGGYRRALEGSCRFSC